jgi:membrane fusion protein (multidrug efflux system)
LKVGIIGRTWPVLMAALLSVAVPASAGTPELLADVPSCLVKPKQVIQLGSPVFGALARIFVDRAERVKEGQVVAKLDTTLEESQMALDRFRGSNTTQIESGKVDLAWNQRELERRQKLAGNMFSKANEIDEVVTKIEQDKIAIRHAEADLRTAQLEGERSEAQYKLKLIRSPVDGVVSEIKLSPGEFIYEQTPIMILVQIDPLYVDLVMPAERYGALRVGMTAELRLLSPVDRTVSATIDTVDPIIDAASDTFRVRLVVPNPDYAIPAGVRCAARFPEVRDE